MNTSLEILIDNIEGDASGAYENEEAAAELKHIDKKLNQLRALITSTLSDDPDLACAICEDLEYAQKKALKAAKDCDEYAEAIRFEEEYEYTGRGLNDPSGRNVLRGF